MVAVVIFNTNKFLNRIQMELTIKLGKWIPLSMIIGEILNEKE